MGCVSSKSGNNKGEKKPENTENNLQQQSNEKQEQPANQQNKSQNIDSKLLQQKSDILSGEQKLSVKQQIEEQSKEYGEELKNTMTKKDIVDPNTLRIKKIDEWSAKNACKKQVTKSRKKIQNVQDELYEHDAIDKVWRWWDKYKSLSKNKMTGKTQEYTIGAYWYEWGGTTTMFIRGFKIQEDIFCGEQQSLCEVCYRKLPKELQNEVDDPEEK